MAFTRLLSPGRIGNVELSNRVMLPAMDMNLCEDGHFSPAEIAHYTARAAGGTGMIITGTGAVAWPVGGCSWHQPAFSDDKFIPTVKALADSIHAAGSKLCIQICHHGKTANCDTAEGRPLLMPSKPESKLDMSALQDNTMDELMRLGTASRGKTPTVKEATEDDLLWVIDQFALAADRLRQAGVDAVEVHAAHGYLINTFLSAGYNRRSDRWGGSVENRARLMVEIVKAIRARVGDSLAISVRLNGMEYGLDGGQTPEETATFAQLAEAAGADAIHVSGNSHNPFADFTLGPLPAEVGQYREYARIVKRAVRIPVIAVGRILPEVAEEMLAAGECDFVSMGRQLLADPNLVNKLRAGDPKSVRPCINCYVCVEQNFFDGAPKCAVNPALCNESLAMMSKASTSKHVVVVGGGPAGMEAARIAAERGHRVTLLEASSRLGGTAWFSQFTTPANGPLVEHLEHEVRRLGVSVRTGVRGTVEAVRALAPDHVVVATGAVRGRPAIAGADQRHIYTGDDLRALLTGDGKVDSAPALARIVVAAGRSLGITKSADRVRMLSKAWLPLGKNVVVVGGSLVGLELAEFLAERGRRVTLIESGAQLGLPMAMPRRWTAVKKASKHGVTLVRNAEVTSYEGGSVSYSVGEETHSVPFDDVVIADNVAASAPLADQLRGAGVNVDVIGDAHDVGYIEGAIHSAGNLARSL